MDTIKDRLAVAVLDTRESLGTSSKNSSTA